MSEPVRREFIQLKHERAQLRALQERPSLQDLGQRGGRVGWHHGLGGPTPPTYLPTPQRNFHIWVRTLLMNSTPDPLPTYPKPRDATLPYPPLVPNPGPGRR